MDLSLYHPDGGYYEQPQGIIGRTGDFFTSVSVGPLFGRLLAASFERRLNPMEAGRESIVEAGAHDGRLAFDILQALANRPKSPSKDVDYRIIEPSPRRRAVQETTLRPFADRVRWFDSWTALRHYCDSRGEPLAGVVFGNELLDAFPVHRIGWDARRREWFEWRVKWDNDRFTWSRGPLTEPVREYAGSGARAPGVDDGDTFTGWQNLPTALLDVLPDGFTTELCPLADAWWGEAADCLAEGVLIAIDYGLLAEEFFAPQRSDGTCRGYHQHRLEPDLLAHPGRMDLTAHVNFTALLRKGEAAGLETETWETQQRFLTGALRDRLAQDDPGLSAEEIRQFQTLTHPDHLGAKFKVLVQRRPPRRVRS